MISEKIIWNNFMGDIEIKLGEWNLLDNSRSLEIDESDEEYDETDYTSILPIIREPDNTQLNLLKTLFKDTNENQNKKPKLEVIKNEYGLWLMIY